MLTIFKRANVGPTSHRASTVTRLVAALLLIASATYAAAQTATLTGLGPNFTANGMSRNGNVVVGVDTANNQAAYWSNGTVVDLTSSSGSVANSCNEDGSIIVGLNNNTPVYWVLNGFAYTQETLPMLSGTTSGAALLISANGQVIVGNCDNTRVVWTLTGVYAIPDTDALTVVNAISDDGSTILSDAQGTYFDAKYGFPGFFDTQRMVQISVNASGLTTLAISPYYKNSNDPNNDLTGFEDLFCLTSDGSTQYGGAFDFYTETDTGASGPVTDYENDGFWSVVNTSIVSAQLGSLTNFEIHSCSGEGEVLAGCAATPTFTTDMYGKQTFNNITNGNSEIAFGGKVQDFKTYLTGKGAATTGWTLTNVPTQAVSSDGSVLLGAGTDSSVDENFIAKVSPAVSSLSSSQTSLVGGSSVQATVGLDYPAPAKATVSIVSSNPAYVASTSVTVPQGTMLGAFTFTTKPVVTATSVELTAMLGSSSKVVTLTVNPPPTPVITGFYPSAGVIVGGNAATASVTLASAPGTAGYVVHLASNTAGFTVPATVTVPSGKTSVSFSLTSTPVTVTTKVALTATFGTSIETTVVTVVPPTVSLVIVAPAPVVGGVSTKVAVYLNGKAPTGGLAVSVASSSASAVVPASITVLAGATAANATVTTKAVASSTAVVVTAVTGAVTMTTNFVVNPVAYPAITGFYPSAGVVVGGNAATASVTLASAAPTGGEVVHLTSNTVGVTVPATVTVPSGKTSVSFSLTSTPVNAVTNVQLTATLGTSTENTIVTVIPPSVSLVRVSPSPVVGGASTKVAVYLNGKAPTGGFAVSVASSSSSAVVPTTITVLAGATSANATVTTTAGTAATTVVVTAKTGSTSVDTTMVVNP